MLTRRVLLAVSMVLAAGLAGCGTSDETPNRYRTVGSGPTSTPLGALPVDLGILKDQTAYQPARFAGAETSSGETPAGGDAAAGGDTDEVRAFAKELLVGLTQFDVEAMLGAINPEQVAALDEHKSLLIATADKAKVLVATIAEKSGQDGTSNASQQIDVVLASLKFEMLDADNATIGLDPAALTGVGGGPIPVVLLRLAASTGPISVPIRKQAEGWKIELPGPVTPEMAAKMATVLPAVQEILDKLTDKIDQMDAEVFKDPASMQQAMTQAAFMAMSELSPESQALLASLSNAGAAPGTPAEGAAPPEGAPAEGEQPKGEAPADPNKPQGGKGGRKP